jgi:RNA polymerase sigma factor (TIGR02999 family)
MRRERGEHTLQATALVNEAYVRLCGGSDQPNWNDRAHFFAVAAQQMRRILVDHARRVQSEKRGGDQVMFELLEGDGGTVGFDERLVAVDQALARLHALDERAARVIGRDPIRLYGPFHGPRVHDLAGLCAAPCG